MLPVTTNKVRFLNKSENANERQNYSKWWKELIEHYGTSVSYYTHGYSLTGHNFLYGEDPTSRFIKTDDVILFTNITNDSLMLSKFGIMADCDMTCVAHISSFYEKFGPGFEPKAGDLIRLTEYGADRPGGRAAPIYEITERDDEFIQMTNPLIGHYVWYIKCKRFEYSYEPGVEDSITNIQAADNDFYGRVEGSINPVEIDKPYIDSVQGETECIFNTEEISTNDLTPGQPAPIQCRTLPPDQQPQVVQAPVVIRSRGGGRYDYYDPYNAGLDNTPAVPPSDL